MARSAHGSVAPGSVPPQPAGFLQHLLHIRQEGLFERRAVGHGRIGRGNAENRPVQVFEDRLGDAHRQLARQARGAGVLVDQQHLRGLFDALADGFAIERQQRAQIDHLGRGAFRSQPFGGFEGSPDHGAVGHDGQVFAFPDDLGLADGHGVIGGRKVLLDLAVEALVLEEDDGVVVANCGLDEAFGIVGRRRRDDLQAGRLDEPHFRVLGMERAAVDTAARGSADHDRHGRVPAVAAFGGEIHNLVETAGNKIGELHFGDRPKAEKRRADGGPHNGGLGNGRIDDALFAEALEEAGGKRVVDTPISEAAIVGAAIGASFLGLRPVAEMQFADFISCGFDQIVNFAAKCRYRWDAPVPIVIRAPSGGGIHGGPFHSQNPEMWFVKTPGLKVVAPATAYDAKGLIKAAIRDNDPVIFFEHKGLYRKIKEDLPAADYTVPIGKAKVVREGKDLTIVAYGAMVWTALEAAERLAGEGASVEVVDLRTLLPLDRETVCESVKKTSKVLLVHEDTRTAGLAGELAVSITETVFEYLDGPILRVTAPDTPVPYSPPLEEAFLPNVEKVLEKARWLWRY